MLPALYGQIILPQAVVTELDIGRSLGILLPDLALLAWTVVRQAQNLSATSPVAEVLGTGEREALALALEIPGSLVLLDDALGRRYAEALGVRITGTLGIILKAKQRNYLASVKPVLDQLDRLNFRLDASTRTNVLRLAEEWLE